MTDHLPECQRWFTDMPEPDECPACGMFRACEKRVLDAARDAGAAVRHAEREACAQSDLDDVAYLLGQRAERDRIRQAVVPLLAPLLRHAPTAANWESTDALIRRTAGDIKRVIDGGES